MCYDDQARPPQPPGNPGDAGGQDITLTSADGTPFSAYAAIPALPTNSRIIIYPDVRGLHQFYKDLALRFAEIGISAVAIDYFGRTAGQTSRDESFEYMPHVQQIKLENVIADLKAAKDYEAENIGNHQQTFVVGFCMGGSLTIATGTEADLGLHGLIAFYAGMSRNFGGKGTALDLATQVKYPVLGLFGGKDQGIPVEQVNLLRHRLVEANVRQEIVVYPEATHSFFDRRYEEFAEASADSWKRILNFIATGDPTQTDAVEIK
jgi:carboxymethylenebutenolidase